MSDSTNNSSIVIPSPATSTHRRLDIQGLRAIAVIMVVAFHAGLPVPGGFVGVDVFFVISGFVITAMLHREWLNHGCIRFRNFYMKRFKRLAPALALVVAVTMIFSAIILSPFGTQTNSARTGIGAMLSIANFVIARITGGYFDPAAETNPLLNTWSLSVEEQFYLIFPAVLVLGWVLAKRTTRLSGAPFLLISVIAILSFGLTLAQTFGQTFLGSEILLGFYSPFARAWEFAVGALLAIALTKITISITAQIMSVVGTVGIGLLAASLWLIDGSRSSPGPWTLLPVTGTLLLLLAGTCENRVSRTLSTKPLVKIGDWSYSIYLWHWPFIVFSIYLWPYSPYAAIIAAVVSLAPALASFYWLEQPIRQRVIKTRIQSTKLIAAVMIPPLALAALVGVTAKYYWQAQYESGDIPALFPGDVAISDPWAYLRGPYFPCNDEKVLYASLGDNYTTPCGQSVPNTNIDVALVGDSHASHLFYGLAESLTDQNIAYYTKSGTRPIYDGAEMSRVIDYVAQNPFIRTVIISAYWGGFDAEVELAQTLRTFTDNGKQVFVTDDVPRSPFPAYACKFGITPLFPTPRCTQPLDNFEALHSTYLPVLKGAIDQVPGAELLRTAKYFCDESECDMTRDGTIMYFDETHLNHQGSAYLAKRLLAENPEFASAVSAKELA
jgi:peptidoglycan/LPS O-acetylase OafA/YrhL